MNRPPHDEGARAEIAFGDVFREHYDAVWRVACSLAGREAADDVTQEVFILVRRLLPRFRTGSLRAWLFAIVRNVARNDLRGRRRRERHVHAMVESMPPGGRSPQEWAELRQAAELLQAFLDSLPEAQRTAFVLMDMEGLTAREIADALGVPTRTVYSRVRVAREAFARLTERNVEEGERS